MVVEGLVGALVQDLNLGSILMMILNLLWLSGFLWRNREPASRQREVVVRMLQLPLLLLVGLRMRVVRKLCSRELSPCPWTQESQAKQLLRRET